MKDVVGIYGLLFHINPRHFHINSRFRIDRVDGNRRLIAVTLSRANHKPAEARNCYQIDFLVVQLGSYHFQASASRAINHQEEQKSELQK
jgi:hypothetical protein